MAIELVSLSSGAAKLVLAPSLGGGIARLDVGDKPVLRSWSGDENDMFSLACNVLVPFSNRISNGGFNWHGHRHEVKTNMAGEPFPLHGDGFQKPWKLIECSENSATLELQGGAIGPWQYSARQTFKLNDDGLVIDLAVKNISSGPSLPFGCGFHPWFPRNEDTKLSFVADGVWLEDARHLPTKHLPIADAPELDFTKARALPDSLINNPFTGWRGTARIEQGAKAASLGISAQSLLTTAIVYSPDKQSDFFCFEPVSHTVDAFNLDGQPGLAELAENQEIQTSVTFNWDGEDSAS